MRRLVGFVHWFLLRTSTDCARPPRGAHISLSSLAAVGGSSVVCFAVCVFLVSGCRVVPLATVLRGVFGKEVCTPAAFVLLTYVLSGFCPINPINLCTNLRSYAIVYFVLPFEHE